MNHRIQDHRTPIEWLIARRADTGEKFGLVMDLTLSGMRILTHEPCSPKDVVELVLATPAGFDGPAQVRVHAICKWSRPADGEHFDVGMGISGQISNDDLRAVATVFYKHSA